MHRYAFILLASLLFPVSGLQAFEGRLDSMFTYAQEGPTFELLRPYEKSGAGKTAFLREEEKSPKPGALNRHDKDLLLLSTVLLAIDWGQTRDIVARPDEFYETNPFLGPHPRRSRVDAYFAGWILANCAVTRLLEGDLRKAWLWSINTIQLGVVQNNVNIGLKVNF